MGDRQEVKTVALAAGVARAVACAYHGITVAETLGVSGAVIKVYDNASAASGTIIDEVRLGAGLSNSTWYDRGIACVNGIFVAVSGAGTAEGSLRYSD